jgi:FkbM family methyltransferase
MSIANAFKNRLRALVPVHGKARIISNPSDPPHRPGTMVGLLAGLRRRGPAVQTIIDVGASDGRWSLDALRFFPDANYLLVEAQNCHADALRAFAETHTKSQIVMAAAGAGKGTIFFDASDPFGGQASQKEDKGKVSVPVTSLDIEVAEAGFEGPYLVKLDTHGYEIPILKGSERILCEAAALIIECYNFRISPECLMFHELCHFLSQQGFRCLDVADVLHRELDGAFWQMDALFVREDREEFRSSVYRHEISSRT